MTDLVLEGRRSFTTLEGSGFVRLKEHSQGNGWGQVQGTTRVSSIRRDQESRAASEGRLGYKQKGVIRGRGAY